MASAGTVSVDFAAETAKFTAELKKVQSSLKRLETDFKSVERVAGVALRFFSGAALVGFAKSAFQAADATATAAERAGIAVESFSRLQFAAGQTDTEMGALTAGIQRLQVSLSKASSGSSETQQTFARLGLEVAKLRSLSVEDQLGEVAAAFQKISDPATRTRLAVELFGRSAGPQLVPLLALGKEGIAQLTAEADRLGITLTDTTAKGIDHADKAIKQLTGTLSAYAAKFAAGLSIVIFGPPEELLKLDQKAAQLIERRRQILSGVGGDLSRLTEAANPLRKELDSINKEIEAIFKQQDLIRENIAATEKAKAAQTAAENFENPAIQEVNLEAIRSMKIEVDELAQAYHNLANATAEVQRQRLQSVVVDPGEVARQMVDANVAELERQANIAQYYRELDVQRETEAANAMVNARVGALNAVQSALQSFAGRSEKAAKALILVEKARALFQAFVNTKAAITLQLSSGDPYTAVARAVAVGAFGALQIAAIAASGYGQIKGVGNGGAPIGHPANPVFTQPAGEDGRAFGASSQSAVQVIIANNVGFDERVMRRIVDGIREVIDDQDLLIFGPNSRQAQEIRGA
jgi:hypothetical protein